MHAAKFEEEKKKKQPQKKANKNIYMIFFFLFYFLFTFFPEKLLNNIQSSVAFYGSQASQEIM